MTPFEQDLVGARMLEKRCMMTDVVGYAGQRCLQTVVHVCMLCTDILLSAEHVHQSQILVSLALVYMYGRVQLPYFRVQALRCTCTCRQRSNSALRPIKYVLRAANWAVQSNTWLLSTPKGVVFTFPFFSFSFSFLRAASQITKRGP